MNPVREKEPGQGEGQATAERDYGEGSQLAEAEGAPGVPCTWTGNRK